MEIIISVLDVVGRIMTVVTFLGLVALIVACAKGLFPILVRFGINRSKLKIAVVAENVNKYEEIKQTLAKNKLIPRSNIDWVIPEMTKDIDKYSAVIICEDALDILENIIGCLPSKTCLIVYTPKLQLDEKQRQVLQKQPVSALVNFRGRLLSDVMAMLVSAQNVEK